MYSIKPWGRAAIVGSTVGGTALGVGMRWRETVVDLVEKNMNPNYEKSMHRRCVISRNAVRLLADIGVSEDILMRSLRPAGQWKFVTSELETMRVGNTYPGCAPTEAVFHVPYGTLLRTLRREFLKFGGMVHWGTEAYEPYPQPDTTGFWCLKKDYGTFPELEAIVGSSRSHKAAAEVLFGPNPEVGTARFSVKRGISGEVPDIIRHVFAKETDFVMVLGKQLCLHVWCPDCSAEQGSRFAWRMTAFGDVDINAGVEALHPALRQMMATSKEVVHEDIVLPTGAPALLDDAKGSRLSVIDDALMPVDPFEWRGDNALVAIEDAANLCQRLYKPKYHRGFTPVDMREYEMDAMAKRMQLLQRDFRDADMFLNAFPEFPRQDSEKKPKAAVEE